MDYVNKFTNYAHSNWLMGRGVAKVPYKESPFTRAPYLQRFRAAQTKPSPI